MQHPWQARSVRKKGTLKEQTDNLIRRESDNYVYSQKGDECKVGVALGLDYKFARGNTKEREQGC